MKMAFVCEIPVDYVEVKAPKTWIEAEVYCNEIGGNLASVLSYADNSKVLGACSNKEGRCWIGLNDLGIPGEYVWSVLCVSDSYIGLDQRVEVRIVVG